MFNKTFHYENPTPLKNKSAKTDVVNLTKTRMTLILPVVTSVQRSQIFKKKKIVIFYARHLNNNFCVLVARTHIPDNINHLTLFHFIYVV